MLKPPCRVIVRIKMGSPGEPLTSICRDRTVTWICLLFSYKGPWTQGIQKGRLGRASGPKHPLLVAADQDPSIHLPG